LVDPLTAKCLGIQENDLWIAAQAYESNLVLVTHDKMDRLREVASDLLAFEDWAE
jgi:predicted nucleic acid-binding protein